jgi:CDP-glycerol glycerophosphotransferase (TagB/SpsB family)
MYEKKFNNHKNFVKRYSLKGFFIFLKAKFAVISHGHGDFGLYMKNQKFIIQVWHGTPIKKIGNYDHNKNLKSLTYYDLFIVGSQSEKHYMSSAFMLEEERFLVSGLPRNDSLLSFKKSECTNMFLNTLKNKKVILYAPTFRDYGETKFFPFDDFNLDELINNLLDLNIVLLVRPHPNDKNNINYLNKLSQKSSKTILLANNTVIEDINNLLPYVDIIVTDYSSIYIDLLLKDIPPIFIPYDLKQYEKERGLAYDYSLVTPGPKVFTQKSFLSAIDDARNGAINYKKERLFVKKMFHQYDDAKACKRITQAIKEIV